MSLESCGCKGARSCLLCAKSERVQKLKFLSVQSEDDQFFEYEKLYFCATCQAAFPIDLQSTSLQDFQGLFALRQGFHLSHGSEEEAFHFDGPLVLDFLTSEEEADIVAKIERTDWHPSQSGRRKQDYGPKVNFKKQKMRLEPFLGMPDYADLILERMRKLAPEKLANYIPLELCNLEYEPCRGSAIDFHIDDTWVWGERLVSINLLAPSIMTLSQETERRLLLIPMPRRSLLAMAGHIRYSWNHGILRSHIPSRRIALTMREPSALFLPGGDLFERWGRELLRRSSQRLTI